MSRYINADKILSHLNDEIEGYCKLCESGDCDINCRLIDYGTYLGLKYSNPINYGTYLGLKYSKSLVETAETANVVQVVRCKDCAVPHNQWTGCPKLNGLLTSPDFYCSYGERRKEDEEK